MTRQTVLGHSWRHGPPAPAAFWRPARCRAARGILPENPFPPLLPCLAQSTRAAATRCLTPASLLPAPLQVLDTLTPAFLLRTRPTLPQPPRWGTAGKSSGLTICWPHPRIAALLAARRRQGCDVDPLYINFTSGSTRCAKRRHRQPPLGAGFYPAVCRNFRHHTKTIFWAIRLPLTLTFRSKTCTRHCTRGLRCRSSQRAYFPSSGGPIKIPNMDYLADHGCATILVWLSVPCALSPSSNGRPLATVIPFPGGQVLFSGEVSVPHLMKWKSLLPHARFGEPLRPDRDYLQLCTLRHFADRVFALG